MNPRVAHASVGSETDSRHLRLDEPVLIVSLSHEWCPHCVVPVVILCGSETFQNMALRTWFSSLSCFVSCGSFLRRILQTYPVASFSSPFWKIIFFKKKSIRDAELRTVIT